MKTQEDSFKFIDKISRRLYEDPKIKAVEERISHIPTKIPIKESVPHIMSYPATPVAGGGQQKKNDGS